MPEPQLSPILVKILSNKLSIIQDLYVLIFNSKLFFYFKHSLPFKTSSPSPTQTILSDTYSQHTSNLILQVKKRSSRAPSPPSFLPSYSSHLLLYPFADTSQKLLQHIHSAYCKLPHEIICFFKLCSQRPVFSF